MGYVREPDGIDFVVNGKPLTNEQKQAVSAFIKADKERLEKLKARRKKSKEREKDSIKNGK